MMETTQARTGNHSRPRRCLLFDWPAVRCVFAKAAVNSIVVKVGNVITNEAPQVLFVQRDHVVQHLAPTAAHPSFSDSILPWSLDARSLGFQARRLQELDDSVVKLAIPVEYDVLIRAGVLERLS